MMLESSLGCFPMPAMPQKASKIPDRRSSRSGASLMFFSLKNLVFQQFAKLFGVQKERLNPSCNETKASPAG